MMIVWTFFGSDECDAGTDASAGTDVTPEG